MTACPKCGAEVAADAKDCPVCGAGLEPVATPEPVGAEQAGDVCFAPAPDAAPASDAKPKAQLSPAAGAETGSAKGFVLVGSPTTDLPQPAAAAARPEIRTRFEELGFLFARERPPTIALVGMSNVGKSFFFTRLEHIAREEGMALRLRTRSGSSDFAVGKQRPWQKDIQSTRDTLVYSLGKSGKKTRESLWIIDMRGEVFSKALEHHFRDARQEEIRDFWMILAAAQAFILMTPAAEALHLEEAEHDALWDLSQGLEPMSAAIHLLDRKIAETGGVQAAVDALAALKPDELADELDKPRERCRKPLLLLLTQADVMLDRAREMFAGSSAAADLDDDPMRVLAWRSRGLFRQLMGWWDHFKVDFVTACDGHDRSGTVMDLRKPSYGVWEALHWARRMATRARRPTAPLWRTRWAVRWRRLVDRNFRDALSRR